MKGYTQQELDIIAKEEALSLERIRLSEIENSLIEEKISLREDTVRKQFFLFMSDQDEKTQKSVYLNGILMKSAITSYYIDIHRYKDFSGSTWANNYKQAAYTIKWLVRFRPIQINDTTEFLSDNIFDLNLKFAMFCGFAFLNPEMTKIIQNNKQAVDSRNAANNGKVKEYSFYDQLLYDLRWRSLSGKKLILVFEALALAVPKER